MILCGVETTRCIFRVNVDNVDVAVIDYVVWMSGNIARRVHICSRHYYAEYDNYQTIL